MEELYNQLGEIGRSLYALDDLDNSAINAEAKLVISALKDRTDNAMVLCQHYRRRLERMTQTIITLTNTVNDLCK